MQSKYNGGVEPDEQARARTPRTSVSRTAHQFALASELPFLLVGPVFVGGAIGYFLDRWLGSQPWLMMLLGAGGFFAGVREMMRRFRKLDEAELDKRKLDKANGGNAQP